ncbi:MAG: diguanylate cyclase [Magnetococcales bacterium]|nr:diguanylate cyclase [Magnetococcales bacterium]
MTAHRASLLRQATIRVVAVLSSALAVVLVLAMALQHIGMENTTNLLLTDLRHHYEGTIARLERDWQTEAVRVASHLAESHPGDLDAAHAPTESGLLKDLDFLDRSRFPVILFVNPDSRIIARLANISIHLPEKFVIRHPSGWFFDAKNARLLRWFAEPAWAGAQGPTQLVLFVAVEHGLLHLNALPHTDLFLQWQGQTVASSLGTTTLSTKIPADGSFWQDGLRHDQITLPWSNTPDEPVRWVIQHHTTPIFTFWEVALVGPLAFLLLALLFRWSLGSWIIRLTGRVVLLKNILQAFGHHHTFSPTLRNQLADLKRSAQDEMTEVAESMEQLAWAVERHNREAENHLHQLEEGEARLRAMTQSLRDALVVFDTEGIVHFCSHVCSEMFGWSEEELLQRSVVILFAPHWIGPQWQKKFIDPSKGYQGTSHTLLRGVALRREGGEFPVEISISQWQRQGKTYYTATIRDITELKLLESRDLRAYVNRIAISALLEIGIEPLSLRRKLEVALEIVLTVPWLAMQYKGSIFLATEDNHLEMVAQKNLHAHLLHACQRIPYGFCLCGKAAEKREVVFSSALDARHDITFDGIREHGHFCIPILFQEKLLGILNLYVDHGHPHDLEEEAFLTTIANTLAGVIDRALASDRVQHLASHDTLTGLPNRMLFRELLDQEVRRSARYQQTLAVGFIDLDHFKAVNDTFGHEIGDQLLKAVSERARQQLRDSDLLARMGGDEFTLILSNIGDQGNAVAVCNKIVQALNEPFVLEGNLCQIGASIGLSLFPAHGQSVDALLQAADQAMYAVKKGGRNGVVVYYPTLAT